MDQVVNNANIGQDGQDALGAEGGQQIVALGALGVQQIDPLGAVGIQQIDAVGGQQIVALGAVEGQQIDALGAVGEQQIDNVVQQQDVPLNVVGGQAGLPQPVEAMEDADEVEEPKKKVPKKEQNFTLVCIGEDVSEDPSVPTTYRFHIQMKRDKEKRIYEVEATQDQFSTAHQNWQKQIKIGFMYCPGPASQFVEQIQLAIIAYEERREMNEDEADGGESKPKLKLNQESVVDIDGKVFFISGKNEVHMFTPDDAPYTKKLSAEEISNLPVKIVYNAKEKSYVFDEKEVMVKFFKLIEDFNSLQRPQHQTSFPYACLQNMKSELYMVVEDHRVCILFCRVTNAGKSMAQLINDLIYNGKDSSILSGCSEAGLRKALRKGKVSRFDEIDKTDSGSVPKLMKAIWPPGGGKIETGYETIHINTTTMIATNSYPEDIMRIWRMQHADLTKFDFCFFGEMAMEHVRDDFQEILNSCLVQGGDLNCGKPLLLALGYKVLRGRRTGAEIAKWDELVGNRNQRFSQGLVHLEGFCNLLVSFADLLDIPDDLIPTSITKPTFNSILKVKDLVAQQAERKAADLISDVMKFPEEARKCLVIPSKKGRKGVGICTSKLKDSPAWRAWMQPILHKLPLFDSGSASGPVGRFRGRLVPYEELDELFPIVNDLLNVTAEKILSVIGDEYQRKQKQSLKQLKADVLKVCVSEEDGNDWDADGIANDMDIIQPDGESEKEGEEVEEGEGEEEGKGEEKDKMEEDEEVVQVQKEVPDVLQFVDGVYKCKQCNVKPYKSKRWAVAHAKKYHSV